MELELVTPKNSPSYWVSDTYWVSLKVETLDVSVYFINMVKKMTIRNRRVDLKYLLYPQKMIRNLSKGIRVKENTVYLCERLEYKQFMFSEINPRLVLGKLFIYQAQCNNTHELSY